MKNKKLKLEDLKVQSFVTSMEETQKKTIEGGTTPCSYVFPLVSILARETEIISQQPQIAFSLFNWVCYYIE